MRHDGRIAAVPRAWPVSCVVPRNRGWQYCDVFEARDRLIDDYRELTTSFVDVQDERIAEHEAELAVGKQWPEP